MPNNTLQYTTSIFNYANTCGYLSYEHSCKSDTVQFISSGMGSSDYCVGGQRIRVSDNGLCGGSRAEKRMIALYLLDKYADYCAWHQGFKAKHETADYKVELLPFTSIMPIGWNA